jgi:hypothetical protein
MVKSLLFTGLKTKKKKKKINGNFFLGSETANSYFLSFILVRAFNILFSFCPCVRFPWQFLATIILCACVCVYVCVHMPCGCLYICRLSWYCGKTHPDFYTPAVEIEIYRSGRTDKHGETNSCFSSCFLEVFKHPNEDKTESHPKKKLLPILTRSPHAQFMSAAR